MGRGSSKAGGGANSMTAPKSEYDREVDSLANALAAPYGAEQRERGEYPFSNSDLEAAVEAYAMTHKGVDENKMLEAVRDRAEYYEAYNDEKRIQMGDVPIANAFSSENRSDADVEAYMRNYASAIGDPIRAMESQKASLKRQYEPYKDAKSNTDLGTKQAMSEMLSEYDVAIARMKKIKKNSKRPDLL